MVKTKVRSARKKQDHMGLFAESLALIKKLKKARSLNSYQKNIVIHSRISNVNWLYK